MNELEKMQHARVYIEKLANGIDPTTGIAAADSDVINNVRVSRCLFYVSDILRQIIENDGVADKPKKTKKSKKAPKAELPKFAITYEELSRFPISETPIPVTEFTRRVNDLLSPETPMKKLCYKSIIKFLVDSNLLTEGRDAEGKLVRRPTAAGETFGILTEDRESSVRGAYTVTLYDRGAQRFLLDNMSAIVDINNGSEKE